MSEGTALLKSAILFKNKTDKYLLVTLSKNTTEFKFESILKLQCVCII